MGWWGGPDRLPCQAQANLDWAGLRQKCVPKEDTVICNGKLQLINKPRNGKCPTDNLGDEINHWEFQEQYKNLTVNFKCKNECLRRDTA